MAILAIVTGWWLGKKPSEKYDFVNWDDEQANIWENKVDGNQTTNQIPIEVQIPWENAKNGNQTTNQVINPPSLHGAMDAPPRTLAACSVLV